tara:strand:+ start:51 stop:548 length:498 start_codon:yes stop_codon:yes gene_type:complete
MKPQLSEFYRSRPLGTDDALFCDSKGVTMKLKEYSDYKGVKGGDLKDNDRSICQMLRNTNKMTSFVNHRDMVIMVNFANNAVINLGKYTGDTENKWGGSKTRSNFTEDKRQLGLQYIKNAHHPIFALLKEVYDKTEDGKAKDYIVEVAYYFERINDRTLEYEKKL